MASERSYLRPMMIIGLVVVAAGVWKLAPVAYSLVPEFVIESVRRDASHAFWNRSASAVEPVSDSDASAGDANLIPSPAATVEPCAPAAADWGVLRRVTTVKTLNGRKTIGLVRGGRFFVVGRRTGIDGETVFVGNFTPQTLDETVYVPQENLVCFTDSPDDLPAEQRDALRSYFELEGEVAKVSEKYLHMVAERSPHAKEAANALRELRTFQQEVRTRKYESEDDRQADVYELSSRRLKVSELNRLHREWKDCHAAELPDPEKDSEVIALRRRQQAFTASIRHLLKHGDS